MMASYSLDNITSRPFLIPISGVFTFVIKDRSNLLQVPVLT
jgi:hypothetical protein